mgnify:CR=1 FL=1
MIDIMIYDKKSGDLRTEVFDPENPLAYDPKDLGHRYWLEIFNERDPEVLEALEEHFDLRPRALQDLARRSSPNFQDWGKSMSMVLHEVQGKSGSFPLRLPIQIGMVLKENILITIHGRVSHALQEQWKHAGNDLKRFQLEPSLQVYRIGDSIAQEIYAGLVGIEEESDKVDEKIFEGEYQLSPNQLYRVKKTIISFRQILLPQQEIFLNLSRSTTRYVSELARHHFKGLFDQYSHYYQINESMNDLLNDAMNINLGKINTNLNHIMKTLTLFNALFLPLTFISSFFGMNFFGNTPELDVTLGFGWFIGVTAAALSLLLGLLFFTKRRKWF